ncbi:MAG TPA: efflux RND transporter periplasmic adaptor subunit [Capsulimonadaceae bacterium]|jgi:RND family efflux transporter MFP subunit
MKRWIAILLSVIVLGSLIGWRLHVTKQNQADVAATGGKSKGPVSVRVVKAESRDITKTFEATANIESPQTVKITPKLTALIDAVTVHEGDPVTAGQVLVRLDQSEPAATVRKQQAAVAEAKARLAQARATQNQVSVGVGTNIQQMQAAVNSAAADYNQTKQNYNAQVASAESAVTDAQGRVDSAKAAQANADAAIRNAQANLNNASSKLTRLESLYKQNFIAAQDVDDQRTTVSVQQGSLDVTQAQLNTAKAALSSALAQKSAAEQQASIAKTKGQADIDAANARLQQAKAALVNAQANTAQRPAYVANLQALAATVQSAQADLTNAEVTLAQTVLRSPVNGFVTARSIEPGSMASPGNAILSIQTVRQVWASVPVPEEQIGFVHDGMQATIAIDTLPKRPFTGRVIQINPSADPSSRQFTVRIALDNSQGLLKPGMFARASFVTNKVLGATTVPPEAVEAESDGTSYVWVVGEDMTVHKSVVTTGINDDKGVQITSGIESGATVVTLFNGRLKDGGLVRVGKKKAAGGSDAPGAGGDAGGGAGGHKGKRAKAGADAQ